MQEDVDIIVDGANVIDVKKLFILRCFLYDPLEQCQCALT